MDVIKEFIEQVILKLYSRVCKVLSGIIVSKLMDYGSAKSTVDSVRLPMIQNFPLITFNKLEQSAIVEYLNVRIGEINCALDDAANVIEEYKNISSP